MGFFTKKKKEPDYSHIIQDNWVENKLKQESPGETIFHAALCTYVSNFVANYGKGWLVATDKRMWWFGASAGTITFEYDKTAYYTGKAQIHDECYLKLYDSYAFYMSNADCNQMVKQLREGKDRIRATVVVTESTPALSIADELKKLADLQDAGVLTEQEFQMQKAKLLNPDALSTSSNNHLGFS